MLTQQQVQDYQQTGYLVIRNALDSQQLQVLQQVTNEFIEQSRKVSTNNHLFDLDEGHSEDNPRLNRIKTPHLQHAVFRDVLTSNNVLGVLKPLLGDNIRLHNSKLNTKAANGGTPVHWHQDWGFYPHTNDDLLAVGIMLSDVGTENGPLQVVPGSHLGPVLPHSNDGIFCGAVDPQHPDAHLEQAVTITGKAGDMSIHHVRALHGSAPNNTPDPRLILFFECGAADAWPLNGNQSVYTGLSSTEFWAAMQDRLLCGEQTLTPRMKDVPVVMPLPPAPDATSIFKVQESGGAISAFS